MRPRPDPYSLAAALSQPQAPMQGALSGALMGGRPPVPEAYWGMMADASNAGRRGIRFNLEQQQREVDESQHPTTKPASPGTATPQVSRQDASTPQSSRWEKGLAGLMAGAGPARGRKLTRQQAIILQAQDWNSRQETIPPEAAPEVAAVMKQQAGRR